MKKYAIALLTGMAIIVVAPAAPSAESDKPYTPGLVEFMLTLQSHHIKLWLAGSAGNWELANYQLHELEELVEEIAKRVPVYRDTPVGKMIEAVTIPSIEEIEAAIKARDSKKFSIAFDQLTAACNACHEASNRGYIVMQRPLASPFPNQSFAPRRK